MTTASDTRLDHLRGEVEFERTNYALGRAVDLDKLFDLMDEVAREVAVMEHDMALCFESENRMMLERDDWENKHDKECERANAAEVEVSDLNDKVDALEERIAGLERELQEANQRESQT